MLGFMNAKVAVMAAFVVVLSACSVSEKFHSAKAVLRMDCSPYIAICSVSRFLFPTLFVISC
jgi:hypothetical protein